MELVVKTLELDVGEITLDEGDDVELWTEVDSEDGVLLKLLVLTLEDEKTGNVDEGWNAMVDLLPSICVTSVVERIGKENVVDG